MAFVHLKVKPMNIAQKCENQADNIIHNIIRREKCNFFKFLSIKFLKCTTLHLNDMFLFSESRRDKEQIDIRQYML